ncbi:hypothetical protein EJB05_02242, partial [Eragrostis curvula]
MSEQAARFNGPNSTICYMHTSKSWGPFLGWALGRRPHRPGPEPALVTRPRNNPTTITAQQHLQPTLPDAPDPDPQSRDKKKSATAVHVSLPEWVRSVVREEWTAEVFDVELLRCRNVEEEMVEMLHVALACVAPRPSMADVVRMVESVPVGQSPAPEEEDRDVSVTSPSIGVTTDDGGDDRLSYY